MGKNIQRKWSFVYTSKKDAQKFANTLREDGYRAEVRPSNKTIQKRKPKHKWVVIQGQKRKRRK